MNWSAIFGMILATVMVLLGCMLGSPLIVFIDPLSALIVVGSLFAMLLFTYGGETLRKYGLGGIAHLLWPGERSTWRPDEHLMAARIANTASILAVLMGAAGTMIGSVQMLQNLSDPAQIGPALALGLLTSLYGLAIYALWCHPLAQYHQAAAIAAGTSLSAARDLDPPLHNILVATALIGLSIGCTFMTMLVSMASFE
jgi:flagellar motor component MotA